MKHLQPICLSCRFYRPLDTETGLCRVDKSIGAENYPQKGHMDTCDQWKTCDQQYYIRAGWLKKQRELASEKNKG